MRLRRTTWLTIASVAFLVAIPAGRFGATVATPAIFISALTILALAVPRRLRWPAIVLLAALLGFWRGQAAKSDYAAINSLIDKKVTIAGTIADDPSLGDSGYYSFTLSSLRIDGRRASGQVQVTTFVTKLRRGQQISAAGKLQSTIGAKQARLFATVTVTNPRQGIVDRLRARFFAGLHNALPDPLASFALGLLIGARALIPKSIQGQLTAVGLTHMIAVSGYNLTIIADAVRRPLRHISKYLATAVTLWLIFGFLLVAGFSASIVRAAIMAVLSLWAAYYGLQFRPLLLIAVTAVITVAYKPDYLWSDLGWQLSFLAFFGIAVLAPAIEHRFLKKPNTLKLLFIESLSAQIMTFPLIMFDFGRLSIISPLANIIVMPLVPIAMLTSFLAGLAGVLIPSLSGIIAFPAALLLWGMLHLISLMAAWKYAQVDVRVTIATMSALYLFITAWLVGLMRTGSEQTEVEPHPIVTPGTVLQ